MNIKKAIFLYTKRGANLKVSFIKLLLRRNLISAVRVTRSDMPTQGRQILSKSVGLKLFASKTCFFFSKGKKIEANTLNIRFETLANISERIMFEEMWQPFVPVTTNFVMSDRKFALRRDSNAVPQEMNVALLGRTRVVNTLRSDNLPTHTHVRFQSFS